jgi:LysM repeat protein
MKKRAPFFVLIVLMTVLAFALAGCNRERPAPTVTSSTPTLKLGTLTPVPPGAAVTKVTLPSQTGQPSSAGAATPVPLTSGSPAAPTAASLSTSTPPAAPASQSPAAAATPVRSASDSTYVIQRGDTLAKIATRYGVTVKQLTDLNGIKNPNMIVPGQTLKIPGTTTTVPAPTSAGASSGSQKTYTVQAGDNLAGIATKFGVTVQALQQANNITNPDQIYSGQVLKIP